MAARDWELGDDDVVTPISNRQNRKGKGRPRRGDAWDLASGGYDVDRFYTATVQGEGDSEKVGFRCDNTVWARAQELIASGKVPAYRNVHDFIRDAMVHRLHHLAGDLNDDALDNWCRMVVRQSNMDIKMRVIQVARDTVTKHQESFGMALGNKDWEMGREMIENARETVDELREPYSTELSNATDDFERRVNAETATVAGGVKIGHKKAT